MPRPHCCKGQKHSVYTTLFNWLLPSTHPRFPITRTENQLKHSRLVHTSEDSRLQPFVTNGGLLSTVSIAVTTPSNLSSFVAGHKICHCLIIGNIFSKIKDNPVQERFRKTKRFLTFHRFHIAAVVTMLMLVCDVILSIVRD